MTDSIDPARAAQDRPSLRSSLYELDARVAGVARLLGPFTFAWDSDHIFDEHGLALCSLAAGEMLLEVVTLVTTAFDGTDPLAAIGMWQGGNYSILSVDLATPASDVGDMLVTNNDGLFGLPLLVTVDTALCVVVHSSGQPAPPTPELPTQGEASVYVLVATPSA